MSTPVRTGATYADVLASPEHVVAEVIDGDLYYSPRPGGRHSIAASVLGAEILGAFMLGRGGPAGWIVDRVKKLRIYARERVEHAWLVDPIERTLEVLRRENDVWTRSSLHAEDEQVCAEPFDAVALDIGNLWAFAPR